MQTTKTQPESRIGWSFQPHVRITLLAIMALAILLCASGNVLAQGEARMGSGVSLNNNLPPEARGITVIQNLGDSIPTDLPLTDSSGREIKTGDIISGDLPTIVTLNYSNCPMLCSVQLNALVSSLDQLDLKLNQDFKVLTVSIDPTETSQRAAETKARYLEGLPSQPGAELGWTFATAKQPDITKLADILGFKYRYDAAIKQYNHPAMLAFVSPTGVITRYSLSIDFPPDQLKLAIVEAGEGNVGTMVDQFIMWCYSYDPSSNSYTPHAWRIMRLSGLGFLVLMLIVLVPYWMGRKGSSAKQWADGTVSTDANGDLPPDSN